MTYYYLYQITNLVNAKIYVGVHKTKSLDDGYMGSGKIIQCAIKKHGIDNFKKDILETFDTSEAMYAREKEIVTDQFLLREDTYNLRRGGTGGFDYINKQPWVHTTNRIIGDIKKSKTLKGRRPSENTLIAVRLMHQDGRVKYDTFTGKQHTIETKQKMSIAKKGKGCNQHNSQFGTIWITDGISNKKIKKDVTIPEGWNRGRS